MRTTPSRLIASVAGLGALLLSTAGPALGQAAAPLVVDGVPYVLPQAAANNLDAVRALIAASDALGMTRNIVRQLGGSTQSLQYKAAGTMGGQAVSVVLAYDVRLPAIRMDVTRADKTREITVASGTLSWDESKPGVFLQAGKTSATDRLLALWLLPPFVVYEGARNAATIKVASGAGGTRVLTIPVTLLKSDLKATLNAKGEVTHTEINMNGKLYSADFANYENDRLDYHLYFPHKVTMKVDGTTVADLNVSEHVSGPYVVWPIPAEMRPAAAR